MTPTKVHSTEPPRPKDPDDYWAEFEGIPLMHTPRTPEEERLLAEKGACGCR